MPEKSRVDFWFDPFCKALGLDRASDAIRHANLTGTDQCHDAAARVALVGTQLAGRAR